jgi:hypothetical protein
VSVIVAVRGSAKDLPIQGRVPGAPAVYGAGDTLEAEVRAYQAGAAIFVPDVAWYTAGGDQTGYEQGQVLVSYTATQAALLQPTLPHTLLVWRTPSGDVDRRELIVRLRIIVEAQPIP